MECIGELLQRTRQEKSILLENVQSQLKIRVRLLKAIEAENFSELPDPATSSGLVRSYANFLGLDAKEISKEFYKQMQSKSETHSIDFPRPKRLIIKPGIATFIIMLLLLAVGYFWYNDNIDKMNIPSPFTQSSQISLDEKDGVKAHTAKEESNIFNYPPLPNIDQLTTLRSSKKPQEPPKLISELEISDKLLNKIQKRFGQETGQIAVYVPQGKSWIQIKKSNKIIFEKILTSKQAYILNGADDIILKVGNPDVTKILVGQKTSYDFQGKTGVISDVPLNITDLKNYFRPE